MSLVLMLLAACAGKTEPSPEPAPAPEPAAEADAADVPMAPAEPGMLSEEAFAALHELSSEEAPPLQGETVEVGGMSAYLSEPEGAGPHPGVLVIHEWWGLNDHIRHWTDRLAAAGYTALAVDLYGGQVATTPDEAMALMKQVDEAAALETLGAAHAWLDDRADDTAVIGWCFGGGWSLRTGLEVEGLDAVVMYYGRIVDDPERLKELDAPLLGVFANQDEGIPPEAVDRFEAALKEAEEPATLHRYDAQHAFANPSNAHYDAEAAEEAWGHVQAFLAEQLKGEGGAPEVEEAPAGGEAGEVEPEEAPAGGEAGDVAPEEAQPDAPEPR